MTTPPVGKDLLLIARGPDGGVAAAGSNQRASAHDEDPEQST
jgi:hypothetical protein